MRQIDIHVLYTPEPCHVFKRGWDGVFSLFNVLCFNILFYWGDFCDFGCWLFFFIFYLYLTRTDNHYFHHFYNEITRVQRIYQVTY